MSPEAESTAPHVHPVPGISYEPLSGRARIQGSGLEVFEVIRTWQAVGKDWERLTAAYHWLTGDQLRAALQFYRGNAGVVEARLARERDRRVEEVWERYPDSRPKYR